MLGGALELALIMHLDQHVHAKVKRGRFDLCHRAIL